MSTNAESLRCCEKNVSDEILIGNFLHFGLYNTNFMHTEAGIQVEDTPVDEWLGSGKKLLKLFKNWLKSKQIL